MRSGVAAALLAAAPLVGGCADGALSTTSGPTAVTAPSSGSRLSPAEFAAAAKLSGTTIIDVRTSAEFTAGFCHAVDLAGGFQAWQSAGGDVVNG